MSKTKTPTLLTANPITRQGYELWDKFCVLQRYSFWRGDNDEKGTVIRVPDKVGNHIFHSDAANLFNEAQEYINRLIRCITNKTYAGLLTRNEQYKLCCANTVLIDDLVLAFKVGLNVNVRLTIVNDAGWITENVKSYSGIITQITNVRDGMLSIDDINVLGDMLLYLNRYVILTVEKV